MTLKAMGIAHTEGVGTDPTTITVEEERALAADMVAMEVRAMAIPRVAAQVSPVPAGTALPMVAATAVKVVVKSKFSKERSSTAAQKIVMNVEQYTLMERTTSCSTGFPSN